MMKFCSILSVSVAAISLGQAAPQPTPTPSGPPPPPFEVKVSGKGPAVLFIPGAACSGEIWDGAVANLKFDHECHEFTLAGFAGLHPTRGDFFETMQTELVRYIHENHLQRPAIVGYDFGGFLAISMAEQDPSLLGSLIIIDTPAFLPATFSPDATVQGSRRLALMVRSSFIDPRSYLSGGRAAAALMVTKAEMRDRVFRWFELSVPPIVTEAMAAEYTHDLRIDLKKITSNVLVIGTWEASPSTPSADEVEQTYRNQFKNLVHPTFQFINSKQLIMVEDAEFFARRTREFLRSQDDEPVSFGN